jgi:hypothetical protein
VQGMWALANCLLSICFSVAIFLDFFPMIYLIKTYRVFLQDLISEYTTFYNRKWRGNFIAEVCLWMV